VEIAQVSTSSPRNQTENELRVLVWSFKSLEVFNILGSIGVDMLMPKGAWVVGVIARRSPAVERGRVFQFVDS
jgi:hypothetical protein